MKILITSDWYAPVINGVVTSVLLLKRELERRGHEVRVVTLSASLRSHREGEVYYIGSVSADRVYPDARVRMNRTKRLIRELVEWRPDIVHSQCELSTFRIARQIARRCRIPMVHTYHTVYEDYTHYFSPSKRLGRRVVSAFSRWVGKRTACIVAPSRKVKRLLEEYGIACRIEVIPTGTDLSAYRQERDPLAPAQLRRRLGIPEEHRVLLYLGRLAREKNLDTVLDLLAETGRKDFTFLVVGDGPHGEALRRHGADMPYPVIFTGMVSHRQVPDYYPLGELFLTASTSETQGLTYFEALAAGVPVLCRKDPCVDGVIENGVNGWQYEGDADFLARLEEFFGDETLGSRLSAGAKASAEKFSAEHFGESMERLYLSLIGENKTAFGEN